MNKITINYRAMLTWYDEKERANRTQMCYITHIIDKVTLQTVSFDFIPLRFTL